MQFAIIGCGLIGRKRADAVVAGHHLSLVYDLDQSRATGLAAHHRCQRAENLDQIWQSNADVVVIATRHDSLAALALAAIEAGKHVLVEKPAGLNLAQVTAVRDAAERHKRIVKVGFNHRFHLAIAKAHELFTAGEIGPIMYIKARYGHGGRIGYDQEWRCQREYSGGGELIDQGTHLIDLSRWFLGDLSLAYSHLPTCFWPVAVEDNCFLALTNEQKAIAWLHVSWTEWKNCFWFEIAGRDGKLTVEGLGGSYGVEKLTLHKMLPQMGPPETTTWEFPFPDVSWQREFDNFVQAIETHTRPSGDINDAVEMFKIIDKCYSGRPI